MGVLRQIRRYPYQNTAAFLLLFFCMLTLTTLALFIAFSSSILTYVESRLPISIYFEPTEKQETIDAVKNKLVDTGNVATIQFISKEEAMNIYAKGVEDDKLLLEIVKNADILPPSLELHAKDPSSTKDLVALAQSQQGVKQVSFQQDVFERLTKTTRTVRTTGLVIASYITLMTLLIFSVLTSYKVAFKKDEVRLKLLLGARGGYIKKPFLQEAITLATFATFSAFAVVAGVVAGAFPLIQQYLQGIKLGIHVNSLSITLWPLEPVILVTAGVVLYCIALIIAMISTQLAVSKYVRTQPR